MYQFLRPTTLALIVAELDAETERDYSGPETTFERDRAWEQLVMDVGETVAAIMVTAAKMREA